MLKNKTISDGLWDVLSNEDVRAALADQCAAAPGADASSAQPSATALAKMLVERARGRKKPEQYWEMSDGRLASGDDITVTVIYLNKGKEYTVQTVQSSKGDHKKGHKKK
jgi:serine/threonine protein phosphatase PrpC